MEKELTAPLDLFELIILTLRLIVSLSIDKKKNN